MIPILFASDATEFDRNGIGRLSDCISCTVTEERNALADAVQNRLVALQKQKEAAGLA